MSFVYCATRNLGPPFPSTNRAFGITLLKPEEPGWFPSDELRAYYGLDDDYKISKLER